MKLPTTLGLLGAGALLALTGAPAYAGDTPAATVYVTVGFTDLCNHTVKVTVANIADTAVTFQLNNETTNRTVPAYGDAGDPVVIDHTPTFINERGDEVVRVRLLNGSQMGAGSTGAGTDRAVHGWQYPGDATCVAAPMPPPPPPVTATATEAGDDAGPAPAASSSTNGAVVEPIQTTPQPPAAPAAPSLPVTGTPVGLYVSAALVLLAAGGVMALAARRRRAQFRA